MPRFDAIYARQSVDKKDSVSIEAQIDDCKRLCSANPRIYSDKGWSGKNVDRPDMQKLIKDIEAGIIKKVVVYKIDRISRNLSDFCNLFDMMKRQNCDFISSTQNFDTTDPMGEAMLKILFVFAEMERKNTQARIIDNYNYRIKEGCWASGKAPFGFKIAKTDKGVKTLTPIPEEIEVVKWMFKIYAEEPNISLGQIQSKLIARGFRGHQSKNGFSRTTIHHILINPIYAVADELLYQYYQKKFIEFVNGPEAWNGEFSASVVGKNGRSLRNENLEGIRVYITNVRGVIDSRTFITVQNRIEQNQQIASDNSPNHNLKELSGLLKCADCGSAIKMQAYPTLTCTGRSQKKICDVSFKGTKLETIQRNVAIQVQAHLDNLNKTMYQKQKQREETLNEIARLQKRLRNLIELAGDSDEVSNELKHDVKELTMQIKEKQLQLNMDSADDLISLRLGVASQPTFASIFDENGRVIFEYVDLDDERKQMILRVLVNKILVHSDGTVTIDWKE